MGGSTMSTMAAWSISEMSFDATASAKSASAEIGDGGQRCSAEMATANKLEVQGRLLGSAAWVLGRIHQERLPSCGSSFFFSNVLFELKGRAT
jgi:hypothetical protein